MLDRVESGRITMRRVAAAMQWLSDHWPPDLPWPADIPRPDPHSVATPASKSTTKRLRRRGEGRTAAGREAPRGGAAAGTPPPRPCPHPDGGSEGT